MWKTILIWYNISGWNKKFLEKIKKEVTLKTHFKSKEKNENPCKKRKAKLGLPDVMLGFYILISYLFRIFLNRTLLKHLDEASTMEVAFAASLLLTILFIKISDFIKIDWLGRVKTSWISYLIKLLSKGNRNYFILYPAFFVFDPFLLFICHRNGSPDKTRQLTAWFLLILSLILASFIWMKFGTILKRNLY